MSNVSTMQPFARGDIFAGATVLNRADDDHAGDGRIIQYDSNLQEKGVLWTEGTTHLIGGLAFAPDGTLWAFDSNSFQVLRVSPQGKQLPKIKFADRAFSNINFAKDGTIYLGEHLVGNTVRTRPGTTLGTTHFFMRAPVDEPDAVLSQFIGQYYLEREAPPVILTTGEVADAALLESSLGARSGRVVHIGRGQRGTRLSHRHRPRRRPAA
mgnify:CR=1 FL=1